MGTFFTLLIILGLLYFLTKTFGKPSTQQKTRVEENTFSETPSDNKIVKISEDWLIIDSIGFSGAFNTSLNKKWVIV